MHYKKTLMQFTIIVSMIPSCSMDAKSWYQKVGSFFTFKSYTESIDKSYNLNKNGTLTIKNFDGSIDVRTEWEENTIILSATKTASVEDYLSKIDIVHIQENDNNLTLETVYSDSTIEATVDYTLIVPSSITLNLNTKNKNITVRDVNGPVHATTEYGDIELYNVGNDITAAITQEGALSIYQPQKNVKATTNHGPIIIFDSQKGIIAKTEKKGSIHVTCKALSDKDDVWLQTETGGIKLILPPDATAQVFAKTEQGTFTSEFPLTLASQTTTLDNHAWARFKREAKGILGEKSKTKIKLYSKNSSIKLRASE